MKRMDAFYATFAVIFFSANADGETTHHRIESIFPQNYDLDEPPTKEGEPAAVYVSVIILDVDSIDEEKMEYTLQFHFSELWKDERLNLSCYLKDFKGPRIFSSKLVKHIWKPDLTFDNAKDGRLFHLTLPNTAIKVMQDGSFQKESRYNLIVSCPMDLRFYPMDTQTCYFNVASLSFTDARLMLHWADEHPIYAPFRGILLSSQIHLLKYELADLVQSKFVDIWQEGEKYTKYTDLNLFSPDNEYYSFGAIVCFHHQVILSDKNYLGNFTILRSKFIFARRLTGAIVNIYIPSTLVLLLSWISFWVDVEDVSSRITLGVTLLLTLSTQIVQAHSGLPPISYLTAMDIWLFGCLMGVFSVLVEFAFAYHFRTFPEIQSCDNGLPMNDEATTHQKNETQSNDVSTDKERVLTPFRRVLNLDKHSRKAFPLLFLFFSIMYWIYFLRNK